MNVIQRDAARKIVKINDTEVRALIDTGSDITTIRESTMRKRNIKKGKSYAIKVPTKGVGGYVDIKEKFLAKIRIDNENYETDCYVMPG